MFAKTLKIPDKQKNVVLLPCKCTPFEVQKDYIYWVKGLHLNSKRTPFEKPIYNPLIFNAFKIEVQCIFINISTHCIRFSTH